MANADFPHHIILFGCGNMAGAMLRGWIAGGVDASRFVVVDPFAASVPDGVLLYRTATEVGATFDVVLLGIKPQMLIELAPQIATLLDPQATVISILAGAECDTLSQHFKGANIVRLMPNLAAAIGKSPLGLWSPNTNAAGKAALDSWLSPLGTPVWLDNEDQMNALTALAGSGPAFVYRFIDALGCAGAALGLPGNVAATLALSMVEGAALLAVQANESPAQLAIRVASPGGMTAAGLTELDRDDALLKLMTATLGAVRDRGNEMADMGKTT